MTTEDTQVENPVLAAVQRNVATTRRVADADHSFSLVLRQHINELVTLALALKEERGYPHLGELSDSRLYAHKLHGWFVADLRKDARFNSYLFLTSDGKLIKTLDALTFHFPERDLLEQEHTANPVTTDDLMVICRCLRDWLKQAHTW